MTYMDDIYCKKFCLACRYAQTTNTQPTISQTNDIRNKFLISKIAKSENVIPLKIQV